MNETKFTVDQENLTITIERVFDVHPELLWKAMTDPDLIPRWWGPERYPTRVDSMDVRIGGSWRFMSSDGNGSESAFSGKYLEIDAPARMVQTWNFEPIGPGHETVETAVLAALEGGKTRMTTTTQYQSIDDLDGILSTDMESGARETWDRLAVLVASLR